MAETDVRQQGLNSKRYLNDKYKGYKRRFHPRDYWSCITHGIGIFLRRFRVGAGGRAGLHQDGRWLLTGGLRYQSDHIRRSGKTPFSRVPMAYDQRFHAAVDRKSVV